MRGLLPLHRSPKPVRWSPSEPRTTARGRWLRRAALVAAVLACVAGCRRSGEPAARPLRLGYFPNLTHAQALVAAREKRFAQALGGHLEIKKFNAGPEAMQAMLAGELDVTYVGTGPAINAFVRSKGALRVIAGAVSGGAVFVVRDVEGPEDLKGRKVASPQLGNTQDIALRHWLKDQGLRASAGAGGDVQVVPIANSDILNLFKKGEIAGAWVPEPWGARLLSEAGGRILVDERELWPDGEFATTIIVASRRALEQRRDELLKVLAVHAEITRRAQASPRAFARQANEAFGEHTGKPLPDPVLQQAFSRLRFTTDPMEPQLRRAAQMAADLGFLPDAKVEGLVDHSLLDEIGGDGAPSIGGSGRDRER